MTSFHFVLILLVAMFVVPWLFEKFCKSEPGKEKPQFDRELTSKPRPKFRKRKVHRESKPTRRSKEKEYSEFDPARNEQTEWENEVELQYRNFPRVLPPDWERRRALTYLKDNGKCQLCGRQCGHLACDPEEIWNFKYDAHLLYDADVHHFKHRANGGRHNLENLGLYCLSCHSKEHPNNNSLWARKIWLAMGGGNVENCYRRKAPRKDDFEVPF